MVERTSEHIEAAHGFVLVTRFLRSRHAASPTSLGQGKRCPNFVLEVLGACRRRHVKLATITFQ